jgi:SAM-dependent methyltransferase
MINEYFIALEKCPSCESKDIAPFFVRDIGIRSRDFDRLLFKMLNLPERPLKYDECRTCSLLFLNPQWSEFALSKLYGKENVYRKVSLELFRLASKKSTATEVDFFQYIDPSFGQPQAMHPKHQERAKWIRDRIGNSFVPGKTIVADVGAGFGAAQKALEPECFKYLGFDSSPDLARIAGDFGRTINPVGFADLPSVLQSTANVIYTSQFIEHVNRPVDCFNFLRKCLKQSGYLFVDVPSYEFLPANFSAIKAGNIGQDSMNWGHMCHFNHVSLGNALLLAGFEVKHFKYSSGDLWALAEMMPTLPKSPMVTKGSHIRRFVNIHLLANFAGGYVGAKTFAKKILGMGKSIRA